MKSLAFIRELFRPHASKAAFLFVLAVSIACLTQELSSRPGYESSLILSPFLAFFAGLSTISIIRRRKSEGRRGSLKEIILPAAVFSLILSALSFTVLMAGAAFRGACDFREGVSFFFVGPVCCSIAALCAGLTVAMIAVRGFSAYLLWAALCSAFLLADFFGFYFTPKVNVYDHLLGYFAGPLWDEAVRVDARLWKFRGVSAALLGALLYVLFSGLDAGRAAFSARRLLKSAGRILSLPVLFIVLAGSYFYQVHEGISGSRRLVEAKLSKVVSAGRTLLYLPPEVTDREADLLRRDVQFRQVQLKKFFGKHPARTVRLYFFRSAGMMKKYTGTGPTSVAKLWLNEVYLVYRQAPHPVLKHELAHIYAAQWGRGPLLLPGKVWGLVSDPILLEGAAVAAEWPGEPASPHHVTAASVKGGLLSTWNPFSSISFFSANRGLSYKASGSFVRFVREMWGREALAGWYAGGAFEESVGVGKEDAVRMWHEFLASLDVGPELVDEMKRLYCAPSIFHRKCPHAVANLYGEIGTCMGDGKVGDALELFGDIDALDGGNPLHNLRKMQWLSSACMGSDGAVKALMEDRHLLEAQPLRVFSLSGDMAWTGGNNEPASQYYQKALAHAYDDSHRRLLRVKLWAVEEGGELSRLYREYLICRKGEFPYSTFSRLAALLLAAEKYPGLPLTCYLLGRNFYNHGEYEAAAGYLVKSLALYDINPEGPLPRQEALLLLAACRLNVPGKLGEAREVIEKLEELESLSPVEAYRLNELKEFAGFLETGL